MVEKNSKKFLESLKKIEPKQRIYRSFSRTSLLLKLPQYELIGSRVVRGPDWKWKKQDGNFINS